MFCKSVNGKSQFNKVVDDAFAHGIPVVAFNSDSNDPANKRLSCVTQKLYEAGKSLGTKASPSVKPGAKVLMTMHSEGASALDDRLRGIHDALKDKNITSEVIITGLVPDECAEVITKALNANPEIKVLSGTSIGPIALGGQSTKLWPVQCLCSLGLHGHQSSYQLPIPSPSA